MAFVYMGNRAIIHTTGDNKGKIEIVSDEHAISLIISEKAVLKGGLNWKVIPPDWNVKVTNHAIERWQERYTSDSNEQAKTKIVNRIKVHLGKIDKLSSTIKFLNYRKKDEQEKLTIGDLTFVVSQTSFDITVITVY